MIDRTMSLLAKNCLTIYNYETLYIFVTASISTALSQCHAFIGATETTWRRYGTRFTRPARGGSSLNEVLTVSLQLTAQALLQDPD
jgi:hypothetical protein